MLLPPKYPIVQYTMDGGDPETSDPIRFGGNYFALLEFELPIILDEETATSLILSLNITSGSTSDSKAKVGLIRDYAKVSDMVDPYSFGPTVGYQVIKGSGVTGNADYVYTSPGVYNIDLITAVPLRTVTSHSVVVMLQGDGGNTEFVVSGKNGSNPPYLTLGIATTISGHRAQSITNAAPVSVSIPKSISGEDSQSLSQANQPSLKVWPQITGQTGQSLTQANHANVFPKPPVEISGVLAHSLTQSTSINVFTSSSTVTRRRLFPNNLFPNLLER